MTTQKHREPFTVTAELRDAFYAKTIRCASGCMNRIQKRTGQYGSVQVNGETIGAHVASWRIANGGIPVPLGVVVMHTCNNKQCVNPEHLKIGTQKENVAHALECGLMPPEKKEVQSETLPVFKSAFITRHDLAAELSVDPNTVERLAEAGRIPAPINLGTPEKKMLRWRRSDFEMWLSGGCPSLTGGQQ